MMTPSQNTSGKQTPLTLAILPERLGICRLPPDTEVPGWAHSKGFSSITRTTDVLSLVCRLDCIPPEVRCERDWRAFRVVGTLDFSLTGILSMLSGVLADAGISLFALSTFDTDYLLVRSGQLPQAIQAYVAAGLTVLDEGSEHPSS